MMIQCGFLGESNWKRLCMLHLACCAALQSMRAIHSSQVSIWVWHLSRPGSCSGSASPQHLVLMSLAGPSPAGNYASFSSRPVLQAVHSQKTCLLGTPVDTSQQGRVVCLQTSCKGISSSLLAATALTYTQKASGQAHPTATTLLVTLPVQLLCTKAQAQGRWLA